MVDLQERVLSVHVGGFAVFAKVDIFANDAFVSDSDNWIHLAEIADDIFMSNFLSLFFLFLFEF